MSMKPPIPPTAMLGEEIMQALSDKDKRLALWLPSSNRAKTNQIRKMIDDFVRGTSAVQDEGPLYLLPHKSEAKTLRPRSNGGFNVSTGYDRRLRTAVVYPSTSKAIDGVTGKICRRPVKLSEDTSPKVREVVEKNVDLRGSSLHVFAKSALRAAAQDGMSVIFVDHPSIPPDEKTGKPMKISQPDAKRYGIRPFWRLFKADAVLGTRYDVVNGAPRLCGLRLLEPAPGDDLLGDSACLERLRIYWLAPAEDSASGSAVFFCVLTREHNKPETTKMEVPPTRMFPMENIPAVGVYCDVDHGDLEASPQFADLCYYNLRDYNKQSDLDDIEYVANVPVPWVAGADPKAIKQQPWESSIMLVLPVGATTGFFEHSGVSIGALRASISEGREVQRWMALEPMLPKESGGLTATDAAIREAQAVSDLESWALDLKYALDQCLAWTALWISQDKSNPVPSGSVDISATISAIREDAATLATLNEMRANKDLSRKTYWLELKRRGVLDTSFDPLLEEKALDLEEMGEMGGDAVGISGGDAADDDAEKAAAEKAAGAPESDAGDVDAGDGVKTGAAVKEYEAPESAE